jgi:predicted component of type VI protein secretion system
VPTPKKRPTSYIDALYQSGPEFDFHQAVRLLELLHHDPTEPAWAAVEDVARFRAHQSLNIPPSAI